MEANLAIKLFDCLLALFAGLYLLLLRPWRPRRMLAGLTPSIDLLFAAGLALGLMALHYAPPFERGAIWLVDQTELPEMLVDVDARMAALEAMPMQIWDDWTARFAWFAEAEPAPPPPPPGPGLLATTVLPAVQGVAEALLRAFVYGGSLILLAVCQVMRLVTDVRRALRDRPSLTKRRALEARVAALEDALAMGRGRIPAGGAVS